MTTTVLDEAALEQLRADAAAAASPFIDPALYRDAETLMHLADDAWLSRVLQRPGFAVPAWRFLSNADLALAVAAIKTDLIHLRALRDERAAAWHRAAEESRQAIEAAAQAGRDEWAALAARLPVPVEVWHNWTARHLDGYEQGADHIVVLADLSAGRFRRAARSPLCWTPSRAHPLRHVTPNVGDERRLPDCKACIRHAERLAA
jgi:hypothetical protein